MKIYEAPTLESKGKDSIHGCGSFILVTPHGSCSHHAPPESAMFSAPSTHEGYNPLLVLFLQEV